MNLIHLFCCNVMCFGTEGSSCSFLTFWEARKSLCLFILHSDSCGHHAVSEGSDTAVNKTVPHPNGVQLCDFCAQMLLTFTDSMISTRKDRMLALGGESIPRSVLICTTRSLSTRERNWLAWGFLACLAMGKPTIHSFQSSVLPLWAVFIQPTLSIVPLLYKIKKKKKSFETKVFWNSWEKEMS